MMQCGGCEQCRDTRLHESAGGGAVVVGRGAVTIGKSVLSTYQFGWMPARSCVACAAATSANTRRVNMKEEKSTREERV